MNKTKSSETEKDVLKHIYLENDLDLEKKLALEENLELEILENLDDDDIDDIDCRLDMKDIITDYLKMINQYKLLNVDEEIELANRVAKGDKEAKDILMQSNLKLVVSVAKKYSKMGADFMDLIQEGNLGLMKAIEKFDPKRGFRFSTYATWWIRQAVQRYVTVSCRTVRLPVHLVEDLNKVQLQQRKMTVQLNREPTYKELSEVTNIPEDKIEYLLVISADIKSLDAFIQSDKDENTLADFISANKDEFNSDVEKEYVRKDLRSMLEKELDKLNERESFVIKNRFGFNDLNKVYTLDQLGKELHLTRERVRQIELNAIRKLRKPRTLRILKQHIDIS